MLRRKPVPTLVAFHKFYAGSEFGEQPKHGKTSLDPARPVALVKGQGGPRHILV